MSETPNADLIESEDMSELYRKINGKCARRTTVCGKCGTEYDEGILKSIHFCTRCSNPLYCTLDPANMDLGDIGYDAKTQSLGGPCFRHMNEKQYQDFRDRNRGISMPMFSGRFGELQRSMMDDRKYGSIKENAILANIRLMELGQRLDQEEGSAAAWFALTDLWEDFQEVSKQISAHRDDTEKGVAKKKKLLTKQAEILGNIGKTIRSGSNREQTWGDILSVNDLVAKYKLQEAGRRQQVGAMMSPEEMMEVISMIAMAVEDAVTESIEGLKNNGLFVASVDTGEVNDQIISRVKKLTRLTFENPEKLPNSGVNDFE